MRLEKLKETVHFVCRHAPSPELLGAVKLHKILWLLDGEIFRIWGQSSTGERYIKKPWGPWSTHADKVIHELEHEGRLRVEEVDYFEKPKKQYYAKGESNESLFKPRELRVLRDAIEIVCLEHTAESISDKTHDRIWEIAELNEEIPHHALLVKNLLPITEEDFAWARQEIASMG